LIGITTIEAVATSDLSSFNLDFIGMDIESIIVDGEAADFSREDQELTVIPASFIAQDSEFTTEVRYSGVPEVYMSIAFPAQAGWVWYDGDHCPCSFVISEPDGNANFFPLNDHPLDKATYTLRVTVPKPYEVAQNGEVIEIIDNGDTTTTVNEMPVPMASYMLTINISLFHQVGIIGETGVVVRNYYEESVDQDLRVLFKRQDEMLTYFESLFGEFPFDIYGAVILDHDTGSNQEMQTLSHFNTADLSLDNPVSIDQAMVHAIAHHWFGGSVSLSDWADIWLNEGFVTYAEGLWFEYSLGEGSLDAWMRSLYRYLIANPGYALPGEPFAEDLFSDGPYYRGALTLHALRLNVGDEMFFQILQTWAQRYRYSNATTADFIALVNELTEEDFEDFFDSWLYDPEIPSIPEMGLSPPSTPGQRASVSSYAAKREADL
jgi:aminopeptidase N